MPVLFSLKLNNIIEIVKKQITKTNWEIFRENVKKQIKMNYNLNTKYEMNKQVKLLTKLINSCFESATHKKDIPTRSITLPDNILNIIKHKNHLRRIYQTLRDPAIKNEINKLTKIINTEIGKIKTENWNNKLSKITPKNPTNLWRIAKALKRNKNKQHFPALYIHLKSFTSSKL